MAQSAYTSFLKDADQPERRRELAAFIGPRAAKFLPAYDDLLAAANRLPGEKIKFRFFNRAYIWPAFFIGPVWFFYRKMWLLGSIIAVLILGIGLLPVGSRLGLPIGIGLAASGGVTYLSHAISQIQKLRAANHGLPLTDQQLAQAGGVSTAAGWIAGGIYLALAAISLYSLTAMH